MSNKVLNSEMNNNLCVMQSINFMTQVVNNMLHEWFRA